MRTSFRWFQVNFNKAFCVFHHLYLLLRRFSLLLHHLLLALSWGYGTGALTEYVTILVVIFIVSAKKIYGLLRLGFVLSSCAENDFSSEDLLTVDLDPNIEQPSLKQLPELDFFRFFPLKKSSSSSSSSNSPPIGACLGAVWVLGLTGLPFSLLSTESESFPEPNRLPSTGEHWFCC